VDHVRSAYSPRDWQKPDIEMQFRYAFADQARGGGFVAKDPHDIGSALHRRAD